MHSLLNDIAGRYNLRRRSDRWAGPCPRCGGSSQSDKFVLREDGGFKCYACDFKGDLITWLREMEKQSCPEAHETAGQPCLSEQCQVRGTCRLGDGKSQGRKSQSAAPVQGPRSKSFGTATPRPALGLWCAWANPFLAGCCANLPGNPEALGWLAARGIDHDTAKIFQLGWNPRSAKVDRASLGLGPGRDGKADLWVPAGLIIPTFDASGQLHRLRIRRTEADRARLLPDLKYVFVEGSGTELMVIEPTQPNRGALIVEAELDAIACAAAHPGVTVIALGTVAASLSAELQQHLSRQPVLLIALDADPGRDGKDGAGPKAVITWLQAFRHARFWPVPAGKDPGDYAGSGHNLGPWIESGLTPAVIAQEPVTPTQDQAPLPLVEPVGGAGPVETSVEAAEHFVRARSGSGREFLVVETRKAWLAACAACPGIPVVGVREAEKIDPAAAEAVLLAKSIFGAAEVLSTTYL